MQGAQQKSPSSSDAHSLQFNNLTPELLAHFPKIVSAAWTISQDSQLLILI